ncbi:hypothetical protein CEP54_004634 [Fusarium duplospermum]|uniref:Uncharacterized protein n=1 Tax=Fusarium duplospermum TaxID=1325734 RepID=A0A428QGX7_9HYPO|nr:hypothetical protein CEP54_004634 [Fusarium duplospermum]
MFPATLDTITINSIYSAFLVYSIPSHGSLALKPGRSTRPTRARHVDGGVTVPGTTGAGHGQRFLQWISRPWSPRDDIEAPCRFLQGENPT